MILKIYPKIHRVSCNTYHDVKDLVNHGMIKNIKNWISWDWNNTFLWNKKILNLCLRWHFLESYCFVVEVTLKKNQIVFWNFAGTVLEQPWSQTHKTFFFTWRFLKEGNLGVLCVYFSVLLLCSSSFPWESFSLFLWNFEIFSTTLIVIRLRKFGACSLFYVSIWNLFLPFWNYAPLLGLLNFFHDMYR